VVERDELQGQVSRRLRGSENRTTHTERARKRALSFFSGFAAVAGKGFPRGMPTAKRTGAASVFRKRTGIPYIVPIDGDKPDAA
jgi:hypothetical protein